VRARLVAAIAAAAIIALAVGAAGAAAPQGDTRTNAGATRPVVFVANAEGGTVSIVDARRLRVLRTIDVIPDGGQATPGEEDPAQALIGQQLVELAGGQNFVQDQDVSPDGRVLYVSRGHRGDFAAFRIRSGNLLWKTSVDGLRSDHMTLSEDGRRLYVSDMTANVVHAVEPETGEIGGSFASGDWPHDSHLSHDGERLYNASLGNILVPEEARAERPESYQLTVVDADSLEVLRRYPLERGIRPFVLSDDERRLYAQLSHFHGIVEFDLDRGEIRRRLELPIDPGVTEDDFDFEAPHHGLDLSGDGRTLCAAGRASDYVALVSVRRLRPRAIIDVGDAPGWAATGPGGRRCFVPNTREDTLSVISYRKRRELARIAVGDGPKHVEPARLPVRTVCSWPNVPGC
jgi:DNA-binding beta-propeller fold protein YncE